MNTRFQKAVVFCGLAVIVFSLTLTMTSVYAGQKSKKKTTKVTQDQFQLTLSTVPYSADLNSAFVRNNCDPAKKKKKPRS